MGAPAKLPPVVLLMGPTASGKTALAIKLAQALNGEIISVDSAQVYRDMDVGTAKPTAAERAAAPHHLLDIIPPTEAYSAARFREDALRLAADIIARGKLPLLAGGTMLYFKALRDGLADMPDADAAVRATIDAEAAERGWPALHAELAKIDPETAARLQPADAQRIQRALELYRLTGQPPAALYRQQQRQTLPFHVLPIALLPAERGVLHERIATRFEAMLQAGLVDELRALKEKYLLSPNMPAMRAVGYRQAWEHLEGAYDAAELRNRGIYATRQLAKRQLTWLRSTPAETFDCLDAGLEDKVLASLKRGLAQ